MRSGRSTPRRLATPFWSIENLTGAFPFFRFFVGKSALRRGFFLFPLPPEKFAATLRVLFIFFEFLLQTSPFFSFFPSLHAIEALRPSPLFSSPAIGLSCPDPSRVGTCCPPLSLRLHHGIAVEKQKCRNPPFFFLFQIVRTAHISAAYPPIRSDVSDIALPLCLFPLSENCASPRPLPFLLLDFSTIFNGSWWDGFSRSSHNCPPICESIILSGPLSPLLRTGPNARQPYHCFLLRGSPVFPSPLVVAAA